MALNVTLGDAPAVSVQDRLVRLVGDLIDGIDWDDPSTATWAAPLANEFGTILNELPDNSDPHPMIVLVDRGNPEVDDPYVSIEVQSHPPGCNGWLETCPVAEHVDMNGIELSEFGLSEELVYAMDADTLSALDGTVRYVTTTRTGIVHSATPNGPEEYDTDFDFTWSDL